MEVVVDVLETAGNVGALFINNTLTLIVGVVTNPSQATIDCEVLFANYKLTVIGSVK